MWYGERMALFQESVLWWTKITGQSLYVCYFMILEKWYVGIKGLYNCFIYEKTNFEMKFHTETSL